MGNLFDPVIFRLKMGYIFYIKNDGRSTYHIHLFGSMDCLGRFPIDTCVDLFKVSRATMWIIGAVKGVHTWSIESSRGRRRTSSYSSC